MELGEPLEVVEVEPERVLPQEPDQGLEEPAQPAEREQEDQPAETEPVPTP